MTKLAAMVAIAAAGIAGCDGNDPVSPTVPHAATIEYVSGSGQIAVFGTTLPAPLVVHVKDQFGRSFGGAVVNFTVSGTVTLNRYSVNTSASGTAQVVFSYGLHAGVDTVLATLDSVGTSVLFVETANPGIAASLTVVSGNNQASAAGTPLDSDLVVKVTDVAGNPLPSIPIVWTAAAGAPSLTANGTGPDGLARLRFTPAAGSNVINVSVNLTSLSTTFAATGN